MTQTTESKAPRGKLQLLLLALVFFGPLIVAYVMYFGGSDRQAETNYGVLLDPPVSLDAKLHFDADIRSRWTLLLLVNGNRCDESCEKTLIDMRQIRLATGREIDRIERMVLIDGALPEPLLSAHPGLRTLNRQSNIGAAVSSALTSLETDRLYVIDPIGNVILKYSLQPDRKLMLKDIRKLLKLSRIG